MWIVLAVLLVCTTIVAAVAARLAFRMARTDGATPGAAWGIAGGAAVTTVADVCTVASALDLPGGEAGGLRIGGTIIWVVMAAAVAFLSYDLTGPAVPAPASGPGCGLSRPKRWASAAGGFTGTLIVLNAVLPLLT